MTGGNVSASPPDRCPSCGATREAIAKDGHLFLDGLGRPVPSDTPHSKPCPEACSCMPECFSMADHNIVEDCVMAQREPLHVREARRRLGERSDAPEPGDLLDEIHAACLSLEAPLDEHDRLRSKVASEIVERDREAAVVAVYDGTRWDEEANVVRCRKCHAQMHADFICPTAHLYRALENTSEPAAPDLPSHILGIPIEWESSRAVDPVGRGTGPNNSISAVHFADQARWIVTLGTGPEVERAHVAGYGETIESAERSLRARIRSIRDAADELLDDEPVTLVVEDRRDETLRLIADLLASPTTDRDRLAGWIETRLAEHHPELTDAR